MQEEGTETDRSAGIARLRELMEDVHVGMLTTMTSDGKHVSRPMGLQEITDDAQLWFFSADDSHKAEEIAAHPGVNVSFSNDKNNEWTSMSGTASVVQDRAMAEELWSPLLNAWFPDGLDTPNLGLIRVDVDSAEYWDGPSSKVVSLLGVVRAAIHHDENKFPDTQHGQIQL